jgi:hypothetical protein
MDIYNLAKNLGIKHYKKINNLEEVIKKVKNGDLTPLTMLKLKEIAKKLNINNVNTYNLNKKQELIYLIQNIRINTFTNKTLYGKIQIFNSWFIVTDNGCIIHTSNYNIYISSTTETKMLYEDERIKSLTYIDDSLLMVTNGKHIYYLDIDDKSLIKKSTVYTDNDHITDFAISENMQYLTLGSVNYYYPENIVIYDLIIGKIVSTLTRPSSFSLNYYIKENTLILYDAVNKLLFEYDIIKNKYITSDKVTMALFSEKGYCYQKDKKIYIYHKGKINTLYFDKRIEYFKISNNVAIFLSDCINYIYDFNKNDIIQNIPYTNEFLKLSPDGTKIFFNSPDGLYYLERKNETKYISDQRI